MVKREYDRLIAEAERIEQKFAEQVRELVGIDKLLVAPHFHIENFLVVSAKMMVGEWVSKEWDEHSFPIGATAEQVAAKLKEVYGGKNEPA